MRVKEIAEPPDPHRMIGCGALPAGEEYGVVAYDATPELILMLGYSPHGKRIFLSVNMEDALVALAELALKALEGKK